MGQPAPEPAPTPPGRRHLPRRYLALGVIVVAICVLGALVLVRDNAGPPSSPTIETFTPAPSSLVSSVTTVPTSLYDAVGITSPVIPVTAPHAVSGASGSLWQASDGDGPVRPVVFFYGAEFAPYPAAERWPLIMALSRFGTFRQLGVVQSSASTAFAGLSTFTFWQSSYSSPYVTFQSVERYSALNPTGGATSPSKHPPGARSGRSPSSGDGANTFSLLDVANRFALTGAAFTPGALDNMTQDQIAGYLTSPASPMTQAMVSAANEISASICAVDNQQPEAVCHSHGVAAADNALGSRPRAPERGRAAPAQLAGAAIEHQLALDLVESAPDPVRLSDPDGVVQAVLPDVTLPADGLRPSLARGLLLLALGV